MGVPGGGVGVDTLAGDRVLVGAGEAGCFSKLRATFVVGFTMLSLADAREGILNSSFRGVEIDVARVEATDWLDWLGVMEAGGAATGFGRSETPEGVRDIGGAAC